MIILFLIGIACCITLLFFYSSTYSAIIGIAFLLSISFDNILQMNYGLRNIEAVVKLIILIIIFLIFLKKGVIFKYLIPSYGWICIFLISVIQTSSTSMLVIHMRALFGHLTAWLMCGQKWQKHESEYLSNTLAVIPILSIVFGSIFQTIGLWELFDHEYTGIYRLQGANIPAHLAMLGLLAVYISTYQVLKSKLKYWKFIIINYVIVLATLSRMAIVLATIVILYCLYKLVKLNLHKTYRRHFTVLIVLVCISPIIVTITVPFIIQRTFVSKYNVGFNSSGRLYAWDYYLQKASLKKWLGHGLGSAYYANDGTLYSGFSVPHNEYIHFYYDSGILGMIIISSSYILFIHQVRRNLCRLEKDYISFGFILVLLYAVTDNVFSTLRFNLPFAMIVSIIITNGNYDTCNTVINIESESEIV